MIVLSNTEKQDLKPGQSLVFDRKVLKCGRCEAWREGSSNVKLCCKRGCYYIHFSGNIGIPSPATGAPLLAIAISGSPLKETVMTTPGNDPTARYNVATGTGVKNCDCGCDLITVTNVGQTDILVDPNASLTVALASYDYRGGDCCGKRA